MCLHNIVRNTQPKPRTLRSFLCGKKRLHDVVFDVIRNPRTIVFDGDGDLPLFRLRPDREFGFIIFHRGHPTLSLRFGTPLKGRIFTINF